MKISKPT